MIATSRAGSSDPCAWALPMKEKTAAPASSARREEAETRTGMSKSLRESGGQVIRDPIARGIVGTVRRPAQQETVGGVGERRGNEQVSGQPVDAVKAQRGLVIGVVVLGPAGEDHQRRHTG